MVVKPGGCAFHHSLTFHGSGPNESEVERRALVSHLVPVETRFHPDEHRPHLLALPPPRRPLPRRVVLPGALRRERRQIRLAGRPAAASRRLGGSRLRQRLVADRVGAPAREGRNAARSARRRAPTPAASVAVVVIASTNAWSASAMSCAPASPPICAATSWAPPTLSLAASAASCGQAGDGAVHARRVAAASTLPSTATPSVPPTSRTTSFIAEPMPALAFGSEPMIASVAGDIASAMPTPIMRRARARRGRSRCRRRTWRAARSAPATVARPVGDDDLRAEPLGEHDRQPASRRSGRRRSAASGRRPRSARVAHHRLQVGGQEVHDAHQREEHERRPRCSPR